VGALLTIGYEGTGPTAFLQTLLAARVDVLCDVRADPVSRKPGFSRPSLAAACDKAGLRYEGLPELGIPREERRKIDSPARRRAAFDRYSRSTLRRERASVDLVARWIRSGERVALACFEADPDLCHRSRLARAVGKAAGVEAVHLRPPPAGKAA
jgi:uncharacterized protein (DUF488 family)